MPGGDVNSSPYARYSIQANDPEATLIPRAQVSAEDIEHIGQLMAAMGRLRDVERIAAEASQRYMELNETDMKALHFLILSENQQQEVTASSLARFLDITTASVTKLLDRLAKAGHIVRQAHPHDRRAISIRITPSTRMAAEETVGKFQASRFKAAAKLSHSDREMIIQYLLETAKDLENSLHYLDKE